MSQRTVAGNTAPATMRAVVVTRPGGLDALEIKDVPVPVRKPGWVRIQVKAFGVNESEVTTRKGDSDASVTYPRVPGMEGVGVVDEALPEMFQTACGSLTTGLGLRAGQTLLIRGGTSTVGLSAATIAKDLGATVLSTTRSPDRAGELRAVGVDHPLVDDGTLADQVRELMPDGVDAALELVGSASPEPWRASGRSPTSPRS